MPTKPRTFRPAMLGSASPRALELATDERRGKTAARGYGAAWQKAKAGHLKRSPLCRYCQIGAWGDQPRTTAADTVDHFYPHGGDQVLFWINELWVSTCGPCHNGRKQSLERKGEAALARLGRRLGLPTKAAALAGDIDVAV